jgi:hypothetical protein
MKHISFESIEKAIAIVDNCTDEQLDQLTDKYAEAQPQLLGYAMSAAMEYENDALEGLIVYYFCLLLEAFAQENVTVKVVSDEVIDAFEQPFFEMLDDFFENDDQEIIDNFCDQPNLAQFMAIEISEEDNDGTALDDDTAQQLFVVSLAIISLLNKSIVGENA